MDEWEKEDEERRGEGEGGVGHGHDNVAANWRYGSAVASMERPSSGVAWGRGGGTPPLPSRGVTVVVVEEASGGGAG